MHCIRCAQFYPHEMIVLRALRVKPNWHSPLRVCSQVQQYFTILAVGNISKHYSSSVTIYTHTSLIMFDDRTATVSGDDHHTTISTLDSQSHVESAGWTDVALSSDMQVGTMPLSVDMFAYVPATQRTCPRIHDMHSHCEA